MQNMRLLLRFSVVSHQLRSSRLVLLSVEKNRFQVYREIELGEKRRALTGLHLLREFMILATRSLSEDLEFFSYMSFFPIYERAEQPFFTYPTFPSQLQSAVKYSFLPSVIGPQIVFFAEDLSKSNLTAVGMHLDSKTGEISGTWRGTGAFRVVVAAFDLLGKAVWEMVGKADCQAGDYYDENTSVCQPCPLGTFRDQERELQQCESYKPHSSTSSTGSTLVSQCRCQPGFEVDVLGYCQPCPPGTYKEELSDSKCRGKCPLHMHSSVQGANSEAALNCNCDAGYYREGDVCKPCPVGSYCVGELQPPTECPPFSTTKSTSSKSVGDCLCVAGYTSMGQECVKCSHLTYKSFVGNEPCARCPQPSDRIAASSAVLSTTDPDFVEYTAEEGATGLSDCSLCASGYFWDETHERCSTCTKNAYCTGLHSAPIACAKDSVTQGVGAETAFSCRCPKGFGRSGEPNVLDHSIACTVCPKNTFQHVEGAQSQCVPCPPSSHTEYVQATSLSSCVAVPGYFAVAQEEGHVGAGGFIQVEDVTTSPENAGRSRPGGGHSAFKAADLRRLESKYEVMDQQGLKALPHGCVTGSPKVSYLPPATKVQIYARRLEECFLECARNVYCTRLTFTRSEDKPPLYVTTTSNYTGIFFQSYWPCTLQIFGDVPTGEELTAMNLSVEAAQNRWGNVSCILDRPRADTVWRRIMYFECPRSGYCPGGTDAKMFECASSAYTLALQAARAEQCSCVAGFYPVGVRCVPCPVGTYKETLSRGTCTPCPPTMTTASAASTSAAACACMPGLSMSSITDGGDVQSSSPETGARSCVPCPENMYCPGLWQDTPFNTIHTVPQECPKGSHVPPSTVNADSVSKCLCLPGYSYRNPAAYQDQSSLECTKCAPGSYKELQENSPCAGRCMKDAKTREGAVSKKQCFCKHRKYAVLRPQQNDTIVCHECIVGAVCPGGFKDYVQQAIEADPGFVNITIKDHRIPFPDSGFFAVHDVDDISLWVPEVSGEAVSFVDYQLESDAKAESNSWEAPLFLPGIWQWFPALGGPATRQRRRGKQDRKIIHGRLGPARRSDPLTALRKKSSSPDQAGGLSSSLLSEENSNAGAALLQLRMISEEQRIPDIHPCIDDRRCKGGPDNLCEEGAAGFMCAACLKGYCVDGFGRPCARCFAHWWAEILIFIGARIALCVAVWLLATLSVMGTSNPICTQPVICRILLSNFFFFSVYGIVPETSGLALRKWGPLYRSVFLEPFLSAHMYVKLWCLASAWGIRMTYAQAWYLQRYFQICLPLVDASLCIVAGCIAVKLYRVVAFQRIRKVIAVLKSARAMSPNDDMTEATVRRVEYDRCLGLLRYLSPSAHEGCFAGCRRLLVDLIPAFTVLWVWHYPAFVIECMQLVFCITTEFKNGKAVSLLSSMPVQKCDTADPWFFTGIIVGGCGLLLGGVGSVVAVLLCATNTVDSSPLRTRLRQAFFINGYSVNYRGWEAVVMMRKALVASSIVIRVHPSSAGAQEAFRNSANLAISVVYVILLLALDPYDRRSYSVFSRVEFVGLLSSVVTGLIFQGSYYYAEFSYFGPVPIAAVGVYYIYALWSLLVECGRTVIMQPYLARGPSAWRYYHRVTRTLARLFTAQQAKIYYNHLTKDLVLEAEIKSRLVRLSKNSVDGGEVLYQKIKYEYRKYFVIALSDALSQVVISWRAHSIPGDWLDFTVRYAFCYCFWQRHCTAKSVRVPLDIEEFECMRPSMLDCWDSISVGGEICVDAVSDGPACPCTQVEEDLLQLMLDDDVYDDSPITVAELYTAVEAMRNLPPDQLLRLHHWYRKRLEAETDSKIPQLREENEQLEKELLYIQEEMRTMYGGEDASLAGPFVLDFFLTVEMVQQARQRLERTQEVFAREVENATRTRVAQAVARHMAVEMQQEAEMDNLVEEAPEGEAGGRLDYLESRAPPRKPAEHHDKRLGERRRQTVVTIVKVDTRSARRASLASKRVSGTRTKRTSLAPAL